MMLFACLVVAWQLHRFIAGIAFILLAVDFETDAVWLPAASGDVAVGLLALPVLAVAKVWTGVSVYAALAAYLAWAAFTLHSTILLGFESPLKAAPAVVANATLIQTGEDFTAIVVYYAAVNTAITYYGLFKLLNPAVAGRYVEGAKAVDPAKKVESKKTK